VGEKGEKKNNPEAREILQIVRRAAEEKKAVQLLVLDVRGLASFTDYFVICHGESERQVRAITDHLQDELKKEKVRPFSVEGYNRAEWVLLDYSDFIVHVFSEQRREFFGLERLWCDAKRLDVPATASHGGEPD